MTRVIVLILALLCAATGCTKLRVATPEQAAALDDLDWHVERAPASAPPPPTPAEQAQRDEP